MSDTLEIEGFSGPVCKPADGMNDRTFLFGLDGLRAKKALHEFAAAIADGSSRVMLQSVEMQQKATNDDFVYKTLTIRYAESVSVKD